jgi:hypothetical protein
MKVQFTRTKETKNYIKFDVVACPAIPIGTLYLNKTAAENRETLSVEVPLPKELKLAEKRSAS